MRNLVKTQIVSVNLSHHTSKNAKNIIESLSLEEEVKFTIGSTRLENRGYPLYEDAANRKFSDFDAPGEMSRHLSEKASNREVSFAADECLQRRNKLVHNVSSFAKKSTSLEGSKLEESLLNGNFSTLVDNPSFLY